MGISSALFSGVSGLNTLGNSMAVIGDNIANVNTIGFKSSRSTFETVLAQSVSGASGTSQVGRGVALSAVDANFSQGSFESTSEPTDMAIGGKGFFMVKGPETGMYYTRAGHFSFDAAGYLVNPADLRVQGWELDPITGERLRSPEDIVIPADSSAPNATSEIDISANLDSAAEILDTGASVDSAQNSTSGFVFTPGTNDTLIYNGVSNLSIIDQGGLKPGMVYSGAEVAAALETALPGITVVYNDAASPNTFTITNNSGGPLTIENLGTIDDALGITGQIGMPNAGDSGSTQDEREFYVQTGVNDSFQITVDGNPGSTGAPVSVIIDQGAYSGDELSLEMEKQINIALSAEGVSVDVRYDVSNPLEKVFRITSSSRGTGSQINLDPGTNNFLSTVRISEYDSVAEGSGPTRGGFTQSAATSGFPAAFNIVAGLNDTMAITVDGNPTTQQEVTVSIDPGSYTGDSLANELETAINDQLSSDGEQSSVVVSFDTVNGFIVESSTLGVDGSIQINGNPGDFALVDDILGINDFTVNNGSGFQVEAPDDTSNYSTSLPVYDSLGDPHNVSMYFRKAIETDSSANWEWFAYVPAGDTASGEAEVQARGTLTFNNSGILIAQKAGDETEWLTESGGFDFALGDAGQFVDIDFGFDSQTNVTTQFSAASSTLYQTQDGYGSGFLQDVAVDPDGKITGNYSNGQVLYLAQVALTNFTNPWGLSREGGNNYSATRSAGSPLTGPPGTQGTGRISPNSLEQSNVDLSTEFVAMIIQQRGFQANSKIITTTDSMLAELINLKR
jgi:flagellar hook protein FlgE